MVPDRVVAEVRGARRRARLCRICYGELAGRPAVSPYVHCVCPGGPVWEALIQRDPAGRWEQALALWQSRGNVREVVIFSSGMFYAMPLEVWRHFVIVAWRARLTPIAALVPADFAGVNRGE